MQSGIQDKEARVKKIKEEITDSIYKRIIDKTSSPKNLNLNDFEYKARKIKLESTPEGVGIGTHYHCNARCVFCLGGNPQLFSLKRYQDFFEPRLGKIIQNARYVSFCGFGELLLMPDIEEFLSYVNNKLPDINKIYTTNGTPLLNEKVLSLLAGSRSSVEISLHASNSQLHRRLMRTNNFEAVISQIRKLVAMRKDPSLPNISLVFLVNTLNIEDLPEFVRLAKDIGVNEVICNYMIMFKPAQLKLSCFFKQEITNESFSKAREIADKLQIPLRLPPSFGEDLKQKDSFLCADPWKYFYVENEGSVNPCCYAGYHFGYLDKTDFQTIWNGQNYRSLRQSLAQGPAHEWCRHCFRYDARNINDIRSHISFRPGIAEEIIKSYK
ncbi:MAG: radical SAM protein [Candidatus Omnitrophica bacterium]|nr:radical SAM protein [Candidatus Omnitrophota bacterium]